MRALSPESLTLASESLSREITPFVIEALNHKTVTQIQSLLWMHQNSQISDSETAENLWPGRNWGDQDVAQFWIRTLGNLLLSAYHTLKKSTVRS